MTLSLCEVIWVDAYMEGEWTEYSSPKTEDTLVSTYGLLVHKDKKWVVLAMTYIDGKAPYWGSLWHIPRGMVKSIREIESVSKKPMLNNSEQTPPRSYPVEIKQLQSI
ncbi:hypothetical protein [uncultured Limnobacter sp.]|uniref:hypothetical protein n=1 Tax=uncultured Limnobacter sp. TaxID=199681 RepID=UPI0032B1B37D